MMLTKTGVSLTGPADLFTPTHLCQQPKYRVAGGRWTSSFNKAAMEASGDLHWDTAAILSSIAFHYPVGDLTMVREVSRNPWLSETGGADDPILSEIPPHGWRAGTPPSIAEDLGVLLYEEGRRVCTGRNEIYILLSGGLDSRIVAGTLRHLWKDGVIDNRPVGLTWGLENSRDAVYAKAVADILDFDWINIPVTPGTLFDNIDLSAANGALVPPPDLHRVSWFSSLSRDAIVLAGSYGDSIGRAEFSGNHLLELEAHSPLNLFGLVRPDLCASAADRITGQLENLSSRAPDEPEYARFEHEQQAHYMRGMIHQAMSLIGKHCSIYQFFTDPSVYSYIWSIHPSMRGDRVYGYLLESLDSRLARLPWARTNRALRGRTEGAERGLAVDFHRYCEWISGPLYKKISEIVDPDWFEGTGIFVREKVEALGKRIAAGGSSCHQDSFKPYNVWLWLASLRRMEEIQRCNGKSIIPGQFAIRPCPPELEDHPADKRSLLRKLASKSELARNLKRKARRALLKRKAFKNFPPAGIGRETPMRDQSRLEEPGGSRPDGPAGFQRQKTKVPAGISDQKCGDPEAVAGKSRHIRR
ncbi:MAG: hypothetical protein JW814_01170 [Candidatus Krumholzibacteriota bacterium]|nr:hypothetical protein [Candidatus Krumholzibacteriota bacterium]